MKLPMTYITSFLLSCCIFTTVFAQALQQQPIVMSAEVFNSFEYIRSNRQYLNHFELERAELGIQSAPSALWGGELRLEALRSAGENSLMGIDGDSFVTRIKRAWAYGQYVQKEFSLVGRFGLIPDQWHGVVMNAFPLRAIGPSQGEREGLQDTSDFGFSLSLNYGLQSLFLSITNGEGRRYQEQNQGKNTLVGLALSLPVSYWKGAVHFSTAYRDGSIGPSSSQNHRFYLASWWSSKRANIGLSGAQAWGGQNRPSLESLSAQTWIALWLIPQYLGIFGISEWLQYRQTASTNFTADSPEVFSLAESQTKTLNSQRWQVGLSQRLSILGAEQSPQTNTESVSLSLFEGVDYQGESNLKSPVFGIPQLAQEWRFFITVSLSWGPAPLSTLPINPENLFRF